MKTLIKQTKQKARDEAIKTAKQMMGELGEIPKKGVDLAIGESGSGNNQDSSNPEDVFTTATIHKEDPVTKKRLAYLQKEIDDLKNKRFQEESIARQQEEQQVQNQKDENRQNGDPWEGHTSKKKLNIAFMQGRKKKGTAEMIKSKK